MISCNLKPVYPWGRFPLTSFDAACFWDPWSVRICCLGGEIIRELHFCVVRTFIKLVNKLSYKLSAFKCYFEIEYHNISHILQKSLFKSDNIRKWLDICFNQLEIIWWFGLQVSLYFIRQCRAYLDVCATVAVISSAASVINMSFLHPDRLSIWSIKPKKQRRACGSSVLSIVYHDRLCRKEEQCLISKFLTP
jgi:hypothetical protein